MIVKFIANAGIGDREWSTGNIAEITAQEYAALNLSCRMASKEEVESWQRAKIEKVNREKDEAEKFKVEQKKEDEKPEGAPESPVVPESKQEEGYKDKQARRGRPRGLKTGDFGGGR